MWLAQYTDDATALAAGPEKSHSVSTSVSAKQILRTTIDGVKQVSLRYKAHLLRVTNKTTVGTIHTNPFSALRICQSNLVAFNLEFLSNNVCFGAPYKQRNEKYVQVRSFGPLFW